MSGSWSCEESRAVNKSASGLSPQVRGVALWGGAVLGAIGLMWSLVLAVSGISPMVVTDADAPLPVGSLALTKVVGADEVAVGDVINRSFSGISMAQWITDVSPREITSGHGAAAITSPRKTDDGLSYQRAFAHVPVVGRLLQIVVSPTGAFAAGGLAVFVLVAGQQELAARRRPARKGQRPAPTPGRERVAILVGLTWLGLVASVVGQGWGQVYL